jgi:hypothetical protein
LSASASWSGVRLLAGCAAINLTLAGIGWLWQGGYVAPALLDKVSRSGALTLGSWNWNAVHVVLWALWLSGWFAFLAVRFQLSRLNGPALHKPAMTLAAAGSAASLFWLFALADVARRLWSLDAGRLPGGGPPDGLLRWTALPLFIGAGVAIFCFVGLLRARPMAEPAESEKGGDDPSPEVADTDEDPSDDLPRTQRQSQGKAAEQSAVRTLQFGAAALSLAGFGLFWQFVAYGPADTAWSLDRLFSGPAAEGWAALTFLVLAHVAHVVSGALTAFDGPSAVPSLSQASGGRKSPESATHDSRSEEGETTEAAAD